jgi:PAS domain S-box-containing protein
LADASRILLVDDEQSVLEISREFLTLNLDFQIDIAPSAVIALKMLKESVYDAVVSDYEMPGMNGIELLKQIRKTDNIPFILFTGRGREEIAIEAINSGADFYIKKGGEPDAQFSELSNAIRQGIARCSAEKGHIEAQERYRSLYEHVLGLIYAHDLRGKILDANPTALKIMGYSLDEVKNMNIMDLLPPDLVPVANASIEEILETGTQKHSVEFQLRRKDGAYVAIEIVGSLLYRKGVPYAIQGMGRDVTERKRAEKELLEERNQAQKYVDLAGFIFLALDKEARIVLLNKKGCELVGCKDPPIGRNWIEFIPDRVQAEMKEVIRQLNSGESEMTKYYEKPIRTANGEERIIAWYNTAYVDDTGKITGTLSAGEDITERRLAMEAEKETNKKLSLMSNTSSHGIQIQTVVIDGLIQKTQRVSGRTISMEDLARMKDATNKIQSYLNLARDYQNLGKTPAVWNRLEDILRTLVSDFESKYIQFDMDINGWEIFSDIMLSRVLYNLIDNTIRHGQKATNVHIWAEVQKGTLVVRYEDNGVGVAANRKRAIFELRTEDTDIHGLMMAKEILAITGITIEEVGVPGQGARFEIKVPASSYRSSPVRTGQVASGTT